MIRPINTVKPPPPRVDPKAHAEQTTRLQAEATKLQNEIRLAKRMGEADAAAGARQRLTQVNAELTTAQPTAPAAQPTPPAQPGPELPAAVTVANGNGGATAAPALFTVQDLGGGVVSPEVKALEVKTPDVKALEVKANDVLRAIDGGKSIDNIAAEQGLAPEDVVAALNAGGMTAVATEHANGDTRTVVITAGDRTITETRIIITAATTPKRPAPTCRRPHCRSVTISAARKPPVSTRRPARSRPHSWTISATALSPNARPIPRPVKPQPPKRVVTAPSPSPATCRMGRPCRR
ncbi:hypothetical protein MES4922_120045 [Mesorhizobium ventifaucium]|uniref:PDZ domain-containing protein n=1 Tax=Mesorhizobium ventifaucium TaxID=666020 RepID=A0ABN8JH79_9HYPH|nr:hypothetical protein [Mesorhizobium ventifaucium]CAH2395246.1 hypothetical protein MES4922_120045 [Mesorhizobium ventifaucium]